MKKIEDINKYVRRLKGNEEKQSENTQDCINILPISEAFN